MHACRRQARAYGDKLEQQRLERIRARHAAGVPATSRSPLLNVRSVTAQQLYRVVGEAGIRTGECMPWISSVIGRAVVSSRQMTYSEAVTVTATLLDALEHPFAEAST